nr:MAG TPA: hypothetical protein [Caudoviricetes sp.]
MNNYIIYFFIIDIVFRFTIYKIILYGIGKYKFPHMDVLYDMFV